MFCPKCSQQQADGTRFCSRCGFPLAGVNELLVSGGQLPVMSAAPANGARMQSPRRRGMRQGGGIMLIGAFTVPLLALLQELLHIDGEFPIIGVIITLLGLLRILYAVFFEDSTPRPQAAMPAYTPPPVAQFGEVQQQSALPPAQGTPAYTYRPPQIHTAEMQPPPSVTDHTTRLLEKQTDAEPDKY